MSHALLLPLRARKAAAALAVVVLGAVASPASADENPYTVTYAARVCDEYTDVTANLARNNIMESLRDLGADTLYTSGEAIKVSKEDQGQPNCRPLPEWELTLGTGIGAKVTGPWGALSTVSSPYATSILTQNSVPQLDADGNQVGNAMVEGAVTVELTAAQAERAQNASSLWVQGGTPSDPVLFQHYPGQYGFAALRCGIDNLNGDNVEWIAYPTGARHVYCYAYYVKPPPRSGTIVVTKAVQPLEAGAPPSGTFRFDGNVSYTEDKTFSLTASVPKPGSITFVRGAVGADDPPWVVTELAQPGWVLTSLTCTSTSGTSTTNIAGATASIRLAARDTVHCTYTNQPAPAAGALVLRKISNSATGTFHYDVLTPSGETRSYTLTTREPGQPTQLNTGLTATGRYTITETDAQPDNLEWHLVSASCGGLRRAVGAPITVDVGTGSAPVCTFVNEPALLGSIVIRTITRGGVGSFGYAIQLPPEAAHPVDLAQSATTAKEDTPVTAKGDPSDELIFGTYDVRQLDPVDGRSWRLESVTCDQPDAIRRSRATRAGAGVQIALTPQSRTFVCTFVNVLETTPEPPEPPNPNPPEPPNPNPNPPTPPDGGDGGAAGGGDQPGGGGGGDGGGTGAGGVAGGSAEVPSGGVDTGQRTVGGFVPLPFGDRAAVLPLAAARTLATAGLSLRIPRIGVHTALESLPLRADGSLAPPASAAHAGWWRGGARPGAVGTAVIAGHVDSTAGPGVFARLDRVVRGDRIVITTGARRVRYVVTGVAQYRKRSFPTQRVYGSTPVATLRLITCAGPFNALTGHYRDNLVVFARRI